MAVIVSRIIGTSPGYTTYAASVLSLLMKGGNRAHDLGLAPLSIVGLGLVMFGALLRRKCYQEMGSLFTAELARPQADHDRPL